MRIAIIYNEPKPSDPSEHWLSRSVPGGTVLPPDFRDWSEYGVLGEVRLITQFLREGSYDAMLFAADDPLELAQYLARDRPDFIFNCCESFRGDASLEMCVAGVYELFGVPYTGTPALNLGICLNKPIAKSLFQAHAIPTPRFAVVREPWDCDAAAVLGFPLIVKPAHEDASIGIDVHAVVSTFETLRDRIEFVRREFRQPALVEEFIDGREVNVAVLASSPEEFMTLPISEIRFQGYPEDRPRIIGYQAKWVEHSPEYRGTPPRCPADLPEALAQRVRDTALAAARVAGLADYGRIDMRIRRGDNQVFVLEANPNPDISFDSGFVRAAEASGRTHASVIREILERAIERAVRAATGAGVA